MEPKNQRSSPKTKETITWKEGILRLETLFHEMWLPELLKKGVMLDLE